MWMDELSKIYGNQLITEETRGLRVDFPKIAGGMKSPHDPGQGLGYRGMKVAEISQNAVADSLAGNVPFGNPHEQEEGLDDAPVSRNRVFSEIDKLMGDLNESSPTDRVALMVLGQLKQKLNK
jgi:hypothetical protein